MDGENRSGEAQTLVLTRNMVEAADLVDILEHDNIGPVNVYRDVSSARAAFHSPLIHPRLVVFAFDTQAHHAQAFLRDVTLQAVPLIVLDSRELARNGLRQASVARPFDSADIREAMNSVGVLTA